MGDLVAPRPVLTRGLDKVAAERREIIARQVRCSTGFTEQRFAVPVRPAARAEAGPGEDGRTLAVRLLAWLRALPAGAVLPPLDVIAADLGVGGRSGGQRERMRTAISALRDGGLIASIAGEGGGAWAGQRVIWLIAEDRVFLSARAPTNWAELVRRERR